MVLVDLKKTERWQLQASNSYLDRTPLNNRISLIFNVKLIFNNIGISLEVFLMNAIKTQYLTPM